MGSSESTNAALAELVQEVSFTDPDWEEVERLVQARMSKKHLQMYKYKMSIRRLFRIAPSEIVKDYLKLSSELGQPTKLFHGTTPGSAERIILSGFELPQVPGMFGRGVYFAKDPLKSIRYSRVGSRPSSVTAADENPAGETSSSGHSFSSRFSDVFSAAGSSLFNLFGSRNSGDPVRHMLLCDVYLGKSRTVRLAKPRFDPDRGLRPNPVMRMLGGRRYDSLRAPGGTLGAVRVTEFVVYAEYQAIPRYLIEFDQEEVDMLR
jgi:hypothetical protein